MAKQMQKKSLSVPERQRHSLLLNKYLGHFCCQKHHRHPGHICSRAVTHGVRVSQALGQQLNASPRPAPGECTWQGTAVEPPAAKPGKQGADLQREPGGRAGEGVGGRPGCCGTVARPPAAAASPARPAWLGRGECMVLPLGLFSKTGSRSQWQHCKGLMLWAAAGYCSLFQCPTSQWELVGIMLLLKSVSCCSASARLFTHTALCLCAVLWVLPQGCCCSVRCQPPAGCAARGARPCPAGSLSVHGSIGCLSLRVSFPF